MNFVRNTILFLCLSLVLLSGAILWRLGRNTPERPIPPLSISTAPSNNRLTAQPSAMATTAGTPAGDIGHAPSVCTVPSLVGTLALTNLPGNVRGPASLALLNGRIYVAGEDSDNVGVVENGQLTRVVA